MRGWPGMWAEAYLALDFFGSFCVKTKRTSCSYLTLSLTVARNVRYQRLLAPQPRGCAFGTQLNFVPAFACFGRQAHMPLLGQRQNSVAFQKLEESVCVTPIVHKTHNSCYTWARCKFFLQSYYCENISPLIGILCG